MRFLNFTGKKILIKVGGLDAQFADPGFYSQVAREQSEAMQRRAAALATDIEQAEMRWLELQDALDALPSPD